MQKLPIVLLLLLVHQLFTLSHAVEATNEQRQDLRATTNIQVTFRALEFTEFLPFNGEAAVLNTAQIVKDHIVDQLVAQKVSGVCEQDVVFYFHVETNEDPTLPAQPVNFTWNYQSTKSSNTAGVTARLTIADIQSCKFENVGFYSGVWDAPLDVGHPWGAVITQTGYSEQKWDEQFQYLYMLVSGMQRNKRYKIKCISTLACNQLGTDGAGNVQAANMYGGAQTVPYMEKKMQYTYGNSHPLLKLTKWYDDEDAECEDPPSDDPGSEEVYYLRYPYQRVLCIKIENLGDYKLEDISISDTLCDGDRPLLLPGVGATLYTLNKKQSKTIMLKSTEPQYANLFAGTIYDENSPLPPSKSFDFNDYRCNYFAVATSYFMMNGVKYNTQQYIQDMIANPPVGSIWDQLPDSSKQAILKMNRDNAIVEIPTCSLHTTPCLWYYNSTITSDYCKFHDCDVYMFDEDGPCECLEYQEQVYIQTSPLCEVSQSGGQVCPCNTQPQLLLNSSCNPVYLSS